MKNILYICIFLLAIPKGFTQSCGEEVYKGEGTYYDIKAFGDFGNCSFPSVNFKPFLIGAMNGVQYGMADFCGACAEVTGPNGKVTITIIDQCPECKEGDIDLSPEAFDFLAERIKGRIQISWKLVPCPISTPVQLYIKDGSSIYWSAIQVRNHRNSIGQLELWTPSGYVDVPRQSYNYFMLSSGFGNPPYKFRITDVYGNQIIEENIPLSVQTVINGKNQFPACVVTGLDNALIATKLFSVVNNEIEIMEESNLKVVSLEGKVLFDSYSDKSKKITLKSGFYLVRAIDKGERVQNAKVWIP